MKIVKRVLLVVLIVIIAVPVLYFLSIMTICPAINDARAAEIEKEMISMELPPETQAIETASFCGNTSGTGNHVEIWAGLLIQSELNEEELRKYYEGKTISYKAYDFMFFVVPEDFKSQYPVPRDFVYFSHFNGMDSAEGYYIVGGYYDAVTQHDLRGH